MSEPSTGSTGTGSAEIRGTADTGTAASSAGGASRAFLSVLHGSPTAQEVAALVVVLSALPDQAATGSPHDSRFGWSDRSRMQRVPVVAGPGGWRASGLPR
jgi:Acyl-CoA carboxylase epsilon subunit